MSSRILVSICAIAHACLWPIKSLKYEQSQSRKSAYKFNRSISKFNVLLEGFLKETPRDLVDIIKKSFNNSLKRTCSPSANVLAFLVRIQSSMTCDDTEKKERLFW